MGASGAIVETCGMGDLRSACDSVPVWPWLDPGKGATEGRYRTFVAARAEAFEKYTAIDVRRTKRRSVFFGGRQTTYFSAPGRRRAVRSDLHDACGHARWESGDAKADQHRERPHHVQLLLPGGRQNTVFVDARRERGLPG